MTNNQSPDKLKIINSKLKTFRILILGISACLVIGIWYLVIARTAFAQNAIDLAITPPILEVMIKPGSEVRSVFSVTSAGGETTLLPKIVKFEPLDESGNVSITNIPGPDWVKFDPSPKLFKNGDTKDFTVLISPPKDAEEIDHYLSFVFETGDIVDLLDQNSAFHRAKIASNILLTISKDGKPKKSAEIVEFSAPRVVDSLSPITYDLTLANNGNYFWKPVGKIIINDKDILNLAPQNIISGHNRKIFCIKQENLIPCTLEKKPLIGHMKANLEFSLDEDPKIYKQQTSTLVFPFSLIFLILIFWVVLLLTKRVKKSHS